MADGTKQAEIKKTGMNQTGMNQAGATPRRFAWQSEMSEDMFKLKVIRDAAVTMNILHLRHLNKVA